MRRSLREFLSYKIWDFPYVHVFPKGSSSCSFFRSDARQSRVQRLSTVTLKKCLLFTVSCHCWECPICSLDFPYREGASILIHGTEGTDSTLQVTSLAQIILEPRSRTIRGFEALIEREWLQVRKANCS